MLRQTCILKYGRFCEVKMHTPTNIMHTLKRTYVFYPLKKYHMHTLKCVRYGLYDSCMRDMWPGACKCNLCCTHEQCGTIQYDTFRKCKLVMCSKFHVMNCQGCNANHFDVHFLYLNMLHVNVKNLVFFVMHIKINK